MKKYLAYTIILTSIISANIAYSNEAIEATEGIVDKYLADILSNNPFVCQENCIEDAKAYYKALDIYYSNHFHILPIIENAILDEEVIQFLDYQIHKYHFPHLLRAHNIQSEFYLNLIHQPPQQTRAPAKNKIKELFYRDLNLSQYRNGRYRDASQIFMFCRLDPIYPCLSLVKRPNGQIVLDSNSMPWAIPMLGFSANNREFHQIRGNTPRGLYYIHGVMPHADQQRSFGKFRRLIIDFVPQSREERFYSDLLGHEHHDENWWIESLIARDVGRSLFRVHGSGRQLFDRTKPYYTFIPTSGCVAMRENVYDNTEYKDQRLLLDALMLAQNMNPIYENENNIKSLLFIIPIDNKKRAVTFEDLNFLF